MKATACVILLALICAAARSAENRSGGTHQGRKPETKVAAPKAGGKPVKLFIFAGQSNMVGRGRTASLPKNFTAELKRHLYWISNARRFRPYNDVVAHPRGVFGPELTFVAELSKAWPKEKIGIIKYARGGTSVAQWSPDLEAKGRQQPLYAELMNRVKAAGEGIAGGVEFAGLIWMQGERDAKVKNLADSYTENLKKLVDRVRKDTGVPDLPFVLGRIRTPDSYSFREIVRKAQEEAPKSINTCSWVDADGLEMCADKLHYSHQGQLELGKRFAASYLRLVAEKAN
ncbi:MAG: sialate O-acetylesterase [Planctomycetota bacterium]|jgi:iduronate 2-sulfatase